MIFIEVFGLLQAFLNNFQKAQDALALAKKSAAVSATATVSDTCTAKNMYFVELSKVDLFVNLNVEMTSEG